MLRISFVLVATTLSPSVVAQPDASQGPDVARGGSTGTEVERRSLVPGALQPTAVSHADQLLADFASITLKAIDVDSARLEDAKREGQGLPPRFAITTPARITSGTHGTWEDLGDGWRLWRTRIHSPGALSINLGFTRYRMPSGGRLYIYAADMSHVIRPFTDRDNETHGQLWTPPVISDDIVVELTIPAAAVAALQLELTSINIGYRGFGEVAAEKSGSCNVDVICPQGDDWRDQIPSVAVISVGGGTFCTGFMVNNTAQDQTPYFMTANHCGINSGNAASLVVFWNYQNSSCRVAGSSASGGPGNGSLSDFQSGSFFRAGYSPSDATLVELDDDPDTTWGVVLAGWDRSSSDSSRAVAIHHPNTDEKRISFEEDATTTTSYLGNAVPGDGTHVRVIDWDLGTTEGGSSGSPLFNQDHRIVGQLHGGFAACGNNTSDWYGRFSVSWTGGSSPSTRLSDWLDPGGTGSMAIDHLSTGGIVLMPAGDWLHIGPPGGPFNDPSVIYTLSNPTSVPLGYSVSLAASFGILLDGQAGTVGGTLAPSGGSTTVVVSLGPDIGSLAAGVYVESITFSDVTNGLDKTREHTVEVGQTRFRVELDTGLDSVGPVGGPFPQTTAYTVTSERPTPVTVLVTSSDPWISLDGGADPVTLVLSGTGAVDAVTVEVSPAAAALPAGLYNGSVSFVNVSGGAGGTTRPVSLDVGRLVLPSTDTPVSIPDNTTIVSELDISDDLCIGDVQVDIDISHTYSGDLIVELQSPGGEIVRLHNRSGGSADDILQRYDDAGVAPDGPGALSDFDFGASAGIWSLRVSDNAAQDSGTLNSWTLRLAPLGGDCPTPVVVYNFPFDSDPGWTTQGQWAFGVPSGGGSGNADPTSGNTGSNIYGYNLAGDYPSNMGSTEYLTTSALDCSDLSSTRLLFYQWLGVESASFDHANVQASNDGSSWVTVWEHTAASTVDDSDWQARSFSISAVADGEPTVFIRWGMGPTDGSVTFAGWNIDDVQIRGVLAELDCNNNGTPDDEDIAQGISLDCNGNGRPDLCDIADGRSDDCDGNDVPDDCICPIVNAPVAAVGGVATNRYLSVSSPNVGCQTALRVTFDLLPGSSAAMNGQAMWVGEPHLSCHNAAQAVPPAEGCGPAPGLESRTFAVASLQCMPFYADWSEWGDIHVFHEATIVPEGAFGVQAIAKSCDVSVDSAYSGPLALTTSIWGDVVGDCTTTPCGPPNGRVDVTADVVGILDRFRNAPGAPTKIRCDLKPRVPDQMITIVDVAASLDAFQGMDYPFTLGPAPCGP